MSGLVAYCGSSDSDSDEEQSPATASASSAKKLPPPAPTSTIDDIEMEDDDEFDSIGSSTSPNLIPSNILNSRISLSLPQPTTATAKLDIAEGTSSELIEIGPIPPKKIYGDEEQKPAITTTTVPKSLSNFIKKSGGGVKIGIPSLKDFANDENPNDSGASRKLLQNSKDSGSRSGLFAILPQPKRDSILHTLTATAPKSASNPIPSAPASLIPQSVKSTTKRTSGAISTASADSKSKMAQVRAKYLKAESNFVFVSKSQKKSKDSEDPEVPEENEVAATAAVAEVKTKVCEEVQEEIGSTDFFSLSGDPGDDDGEDEAMEFNMDEIPSSDEPIGPTRGDYDYNYAAAVAAAAQQDDEAQAAAAERLASNFQISSSGPKKHRGTGLPPEAKGLAMIEVRADDLRPEESTWLRTITDTSLIAPRKPNLPGGQTKRKHQITYLAAEAKAREEELKNQWASNRANKQKTMNKYGF